MPKPAVPPPGSGRPRHLSGVPGSVGGQDPNRRHRQPHSCSTARPAPPPPPGWSGKSVPILGERGQPARGAAVRTVPWSPDVCHKRPAEPRALNPAPNPAPNPTTGHCAQYFMGCLQQGSPRPTEPWPATQTSHAPGSSPPASFRAYRLSVSDEPSFPVSGGEASHELGVPAAAQWVCSFDALS